MESAGVIHFCSSCKRLLDFALTTKHKDNLYVEINPQAEPPPGKIVIPLCDVCRSTLQEELGIDGFTTEFPN